MLEDEWSLVRSGVLVPALQVLDDFLTQRGQLLVDHEAHALLEALRPRRSPGHLLDLAVAERSFRV